jgi:hypothetical protein
VLPLLHLLLPAFAVILERSEGSLYWLLPLRLPLHVFRRHLERSEGPPHWLFARITNDLFYLHQLITDTNRSRTLFPKAIANSSYALAELRTLQPKPQAHIQTLKANAWPC